LFTVNDAVPLLPPNEPSPAKDAPTPVGYVAAPIVPRLALERVATPEEFVGPAVPTEMPLSVKLMVLPLTPEPP